VPAVLGGVSKDDKESYLKFDDGTDFAKTLGLARDPVFDQLLFSFSVLHSALTPCRRSVTAILRSTRIGWAQELCKEKLSFDESFPKSYNTEWNAVCKSFGQISHASFSSFVLSPNGETEVHGFC